MRGREGGEINLILDLLSWFCFQWRVACGPPQAIVLWTAAAAGLGTADWGEGESIAQGTGTALGLCRIQGASASVWSGNTLAHVVIITRRERNIGV